MRKRVRLVCDESPLPLATQEVEIPELSSEKGQKGVNKGDDDRRVKTVPISTLFLRSSNYRERAMLISEFLCYFLLLFVMGSCYRFWCACAHFVSVIWFVTRRIEQGCDG